MHNVVEEFDKSKCCGCLACINACPKKALSKSKDEYGFIIPKIDKDLCINCGKCLKVCPYRSKIDEYKPIQAYAAVNNSKEVVKNSSSGGIFYSLAEAIINEHGTVFGAVMDDSFKVHHISINELDELKKLQKSKYVQSDLSNTYSLVKEKLKNGESILFSGTPCQIAGLKSFLLNKEYEKLFCVDIVCHGVPSQDIYDDYLNCLQKKVGKIDSYEFRTKKRANNGMNCYYSYKKNNKKIIKNWPEDSFNYLYMNALIYRDSCYDCKFAKEKRNSDITLCDYWGWDEHHSNDFEMMSTVSGCIINTEKGKELFDKIKNNIVFKETEYKDIAKHNSCLISPSKYNEKREEILKKWKNDGYQSIDDKFNKKMKNKIIKYKILRSIPSRLYIIIYSIRRKIKRR